LIFRFEDYALNTQLRELRHGPVLRLVEPQVFDLLEYLIRNRRRVVSKDDVLEAVWHGRIVSEATLYTRINAARRAVGDTGTEQRLICTLRTKGFRFVGAVGEEDEAKGVVPRPVAKGQRLELMLADANAVIDQGDCLLIGPGLGTDAVAKAKPDGYTIAISSAGALAISPSMQTIAYDTLKDLAPVTLVATVPEMLVVATNVPAGNMKELVELARAQPGMLNFASSGPGSLPHLAGELLKLTANIDIVHVPYRGAAPAVNDLLGQQVQMVFLDLPVILPQIRAGSLRAIAIGSPERAPTAMEVPTTAEAGMPDLKIENWYGMVAPAETPAAIVAALNQAALEAMRDPAVKEKLASQGATLIGGTPEQFREFIESEIKKWAKVIKDAGVATEK